MVVLSVLCERLFLQFIYRINGENVKELLHSHIPFEYVGEEFLSVGTRLRTCPSLYMLLYFSPILAMVLEGFEEAHVFDH